MAAADHLPYDAYSEPYYSDINTRVDRVATELHQVDRNSPDERSPNAREYATLFATLVGAELAAAGLTSQRGGTPDNPSQERWFDSHLTSTYDDAREVARDLLNDAGYNVTTTPGAANAAVHQRARRHIYQQQRQNWQRLASDLESEVSQAVRQTLTDGGSLTDAKDAARDRLTTVGLNRGEMIAQTETARAFNWGLVAEYDQAGVENVEIQEVEWTTAGDSRVCADCATMAGTYNLEEAKNLLKSGDFPHHPRCRCVLLPS